MVLAPHVDLQNGQEEKITQPSFLDTQVGSHTKTMGQHHGLVGQEFNKPNEP